MIIHVIRMFLDDDYNSWSTHLPYIEVGRLTMMGYQNSLLFPGAAFFPRSYFLGGFGIWELKVLTGISDLEQKQQKKSVISIYRCIFNKSTRTYSHRVKDNGFRVVVVIVVSVDVVICPVVCSCSPHRGDCCVLRSLPMITITDAHLL